MVSIPTSTLHLLLKGDGGPYSGWASDATAPFVLRVSNSAQNEDEACYVALATFTGVRHVVPLPASVKADLLRAIPAKYHTLIKDSVEGALIPNFIVDPASLLRLRVENTSCTADWVVEIKPKAVWRQPRVVGLAVDGQLHFIHPVKRTRCRYTQMLWYKAARDGVAPPTSHHATYCPNYLFCAELSTAAGMHLLARGSKKSNNIVLLAGSRVGVGTSSWDPAVLHGLAAAWDASGVAAPLANLQYCGVSGEKCDAVLDIELLYRWANAEDPSSVAWLVDGTVTEEGGASPTPCQCGTPLTALPTAEPSYVGLPPAVDLETCVKRFYSATTARDVSVIIAISMATVPEEDGDRKRATPAPRDVCSDERGGVIVDYGFPNGAVYRVGVVDLDDKTHKSLGHYFHLDARIVAAFVQGHS